MAMGPNRFREMAARTRDNTDTFIDLLGVCIIWNNAHYLEYSIEKNDVISPFHILQFEILCLHLI